MQQAPASAGQLTELLLSCGATHAVPVEIPKVVFAEGIREMCEMNTCGHYGKCWTCPPAIGPVDKWRSKVESYANGVLFQTVYQLEDSFDFEGMMAAKEQHEDNFKAAAKQARERYSFDDLLVLGAGACTICESCAYPDEPCRFPDQAIVSVEACGIDVNQTLVGCGLHYNNGPATVSYVGMLLWN